MTCASFRVLFLSRFEDGMLLYVTVVEYGAA